MLACCTAALCLRTHIDYKNSVLTFSRVADSKITRNTLKLTSTMRSECLDVFTWLLGACAHALELCTSLL